MSKANRERRIRNRRNKGKILNSPLGITTAPPVYDDARQLPDQKSALAAFLAASLNFTQPFEVGRTKTKD